MNQRLTILLIALAAVLPPAGACTCQPATSACHEVTTGSTVFIGTVESITPHFLDHWNLSRRPSLKEVIDSDDQVLQDDSPAKLESLKKKLREKIPDLPPTIARHLAEAPTHSAVVAVFDEMLVRGLVVRFHLSTLFSRGGDDDDDDGKSDDGDPASKSIEVTTAFGECGFHFQLGETYLVYADSDEDTPTLETSFCTATKRLSDAGADLPYLNFYKQSRRAAGHVEGAATFDQHSVVAPPEEGDDVNSPVPGLVIGLRSSELNRYTITNSQGRFVFDGLPPGTYTINAWKGGYPDTVKLLSGPLQVQVKAKSCLIRVLLIPPSKN